MKGTKIKIEGAKGFSHRGLLYLSGKGNEDRDSNLFWFQDSFSKAHKEVLIQENLSCSTWWFQTEMHLNQVSQEQKKKKKKLNWL